METAILATQENDFHILKAQDDLMIGGYASIEIVDKQNDLITLKALQEAVDKYMENPKYRNVMTNHSNVQVGEVVKEYRDKNGKLIKKIGNMQKAVVLYKPLEKLLETLKKSGLGHLVK